MPRASGMGEYMRSTASAPAAHVAVSICDQSWAEGPYPNLIHYNKVEKGGHFAAWEQPALFCEEVRAGFRSLRS